MSEKKGLQVNRRDKSPKNVDEIHMYRERIVSSRVRTEQKREKSH